MEPPKRFWRVTFWTPDGVERRRYIKCPYLVPTDEEHGGRRYRRPLVSTDPDWNDTFVAMTTRLGVLAIEGIIASYRVSPVPPDRISVIRDHAVRWSEVEMALSA